MWAGFMRKCEKIAENNYFLLFSFIFSRLLSYFLLFSFSLDDKGGKQIKTGVVELSMGVGSGGGWRAQESREKKWLSSS